MNTFKGDISEVCNVELFLMQLIKVPNLAERLDCMLFKNKFEADYTDMNKNLEALSSAIKGVRDNKNLKELITMILKVGNYLNFGTNKGKA